MEGRATPQVVFEDERLTMGKLRNLYLAVWRDAPQVEQMKHFRAHFEQGAALHGDGLLALSVVVGGTPSFSNEVRTAVKELTQASLVKHGIAHVILLGGLAGVTVRAFLNTMILLGRAHQRAKVFDDIESGSGWLMEGLVEAGLGSSWRYDDLVALGRRFVQDHSAAPSRG